MINNKSFLIDINEENIYFVLNEIFLMRLINITKILIINKLLSFAETEVYSYFTISQRIF
ncbi:hypothetical protein Nos7107_4132 [Nostoc sp. PCC 7107]|nr:hypothetical protein Nos7107_4132 [Nostoc sp. PCC 7107]